MKYVPKEDAETIIRKDYSKHILFTLGDFGNDGHALQTVIISPKTKQRSHYHHIQTEVFYILRGECHIFINDKEFIAKPGDAFICEPGDRHNLWNKSDQEFELVVFKINKPLEDEDTVWEEE